MNRSVEENNKLYTIALREISGAGPKTIEFLIKEYGSVENIFRDSEESIFRLVREKLKRAKIGEFSKDSILKKADTIIKDSRKRNIDIVSIFDKEYPFFLKQIDNPPYIIYTKGNKDKIRQNSVAIVGTREPTDESKKYAFDMAAKLSALNITVVSGMARGVDTLAHSGALQALGNTLAVLGCGIDIVYPAENVRLYEKVIEQGCIVSEFSTGTRPDKRHFPLRNRIISALSYATIMVEASSKSGALITTNYALEQNKEVYIAPYVETDKAYYGNHKLYKDGAKIVHCIEDILEDFDHIFSLDEDYKTAKARYYEGGIINKEEQNIKKIYINKVYSKEIENKKVENIDKKVIKKSLDITEEERIIYDIIETCQNVHIDDIIEKSKYLPENVLRILMGLELRDIVKQNPGKNYSL